MLTIEEFAKQSAGNWQKFPDFCWHAEKAHEAPENWAIFYTSNRDSRLLEQSNDAAIREQLRPFLSVPEPDITQEHHSHWACGWVDGYAIRVFDSTGQITEVFRKYYELRERLDDYPILDESDYSNRETEATIANIRDCGRSAAGDYNLPEDWPQQCYDWLSEHEPGAIENSDDQGGYPSEQVLRRAFEALQYEKV